MSAPLEPRPKDTRTLRHRLLRDKRERGAWRAWLAFFPDRVATTAKQTFDAARRIVALFKDGRELSASTGDRVGSALRAPRLLQQNPDLSAKLQVARTGLTAPDVNAALADLGRLGAVGEVTGRRRGRVLGHQRYLDILGEGREPLTSARSTPWRRAEYDRVGDRGGLDMTNRDPTPG